MTACVKETVTDTSERDQSLHTNIKKLSYLVNLNNTY